MAEHDHDRNEKACENDPILVQVHSNQVHLVGSYCPGHKSLDGAVKPKGNGKSKHVHYHVPHSYPRNYLLVSVMANDNQINYFLNQGKHYSEDRWNGQLYDYHYFLEKSFVMFVFHDFIFFLSGYVC